MTDETPGLAKDLMDLIGAERGDIVSVCYPPVPGIGNRNVHGKLVRCVEKWLVLECQTPEMAGPVIVVWDVTDIDQLWKGGPIEVKQKRLAECQKCRKPFEPSSKVDVLCQGCRSIVPARPAGPVIVGPKGGNA